MISLESDRLTFRFPEVHPDATCEIDFQRTLRIPDDERDYPLPPGLGTFPLRHVDDYPDRLPAAWRRRGGVLLPMHQAEAMWLSFGGLIYRYPFAIKVATGKICAVSGRMKQESYDDPYGLDAWDQRHASRCFVSIVNSRQWRAVTGERPPNTPPTATQYADAGLPWFDYYSETDSVDATDALKGVSSVASLGAQKGEEPLPENHTISVGNVVPLGAGGPARTSRQVREMP